MSRRTRLRFRIDDSGVLEVVDPGWDCLELMKSIDPCFQVRSQPIKGFTIPRFIRARKTGCGHSPAEIREMPSQQLWLVHDNALNFLKNGIEKPPTNDETTLLHLKIELSRRILKKCTLCAHRCGVDRTSGELGVCELGTEAKVAEHFVHIGEETLVNPSHVMNLAGCGLRCLYCQQGYLLDPAGVDGEPLDKSLWDQMDLHGARSLSFAGGNPDESTFSVLCFLLSAPENWSLPVVWNCHGFSSPETLRLLDGVVDVWLPDYKYGNHLCGQQLSGVNHYPNVAQKSVKAMLAQNVPVIVRILVLPGHSQCCHLPVLETLAKMANPEKLMVSVRGQYCPDWRILSCDNNMNRRIMEKEVMEIIEKAKAMGLTLATT